MTKATRRSAVLLGLLVGMAASSIPSFAEVQNVKVSGDVTVRAFHRENLDLHDESNAREGGNGTVLDSDNFFMSTTGINVGADLTENVSTFIRIANERDWDSTATGSATGDFDLSQAYVSLKELFYSPLTLRVGTQPIVWGRGFVLGSNLFPSVNATGTDRNSAITANEFTDFTAFDAIRATLDLSNVGGMSVPLTADYVYIKIDENTSGAADDVNIQGVNFSSHLDAMSSEVEAYYLNKLDKSTTPSGTAGTKTGIVNTLGLRGSTKPVEGGYFYGELAYQFGKRPIDPAGVLITGDSMQAWAANLGGEYTLTSVPTTPKFGAEWRFYSGTKTPNESTDRANNLGAGGGWTPIAPGYFTTALREFQTQSTVAGFYANDQVGVTSAATNQHELALYGGLRPLEDLSVMSRLSWFALDRGVRSTLTPKDGKRRSYIGSEWDTNVTYNYTEDVQFGVLYALFNPGSVFRTPNDDHAQELITSVSVKF